LDAPAPPSLKYFTSANVLIKAAELSPAAWSPKISMKKALPNGSAGKKM
jgi:hypothetical protein